MKAFRTRHGLTQDEAAEIIGVTRDAVTKWETGKRPMQAPSINSATRWERIQELEAELEEVRRAARVLTGTHK